MTSHQFFGNQNIRFPERKPQAVVRCRHLVRQCGHVYGVLSEVGSERWLYHQSASAARSAVRRARREALEADIQITASTSIQVLAKLDGSVPLMDNVRLFLL